MSLRLLCDVCPSECNYFDRCGCFWRDREDDIDGWAVSVGADGTAYTYAWTGELLTEDDLP